MATSLTQQFAKKLPNSYLFSVDNYFSHNVSDERDWFNFLSIIDERRLDKPKDYTREEFHYIRYHTQSFKDLVFPVIEEVKAKSFLDVGCGGGDKLALVRKRFRGHVKTYGIEHDPAMATWARLYADHVACTDALKANYGAFDVIYAYWPICDVQLMSKLVHRILDQMRPTAKFILLGFRVSSEFHKRAGQIVGINGY